VQSPSCSPGPPTLFREDQLDLHSYVPFREEVVGLGPFGDIDVQVLNIDEHRSQPNSPEPLVHHGTHRQDAQDNLGLDAVLPLLQDNTVTNNGLQQPPNDVVPPPQGNPPPDIPPEQNQFEPGASQPGPSQTGSSQPQPGPESFQPDPGSSQPGPGSFQPGAGSFQPGQGLFQTQQNNPSMNENGTLPTFVLYDKNILGTVHQTYLPLFQYIRSVGLLLNQAPQIDGIGLSSLHALLDTVSQAHRNLWLPSEGTDYTDATTQSNPPTPHPHCANNEDEEV